MIDFYQYQLEKSLKNKTRITDYRNGRYIGQYLRKENMMNSYGALLDHNFLLVLGQWQQEKLKGSSLMIFPDNSYFIGKFINGLPAQLCTYQINRSQKMYVLLGQTQIKIIHEQKCNNNLKFLKIKRQTLDLLIKLKQNPGKQLTKQAQEKQYKVFKQNYKNEAQKINKIYDYLERKDKLQINNFLKQFCKSANKTKNIFQYSEDSQKIYVRLSSQSPYFVLTKKKDQTLFSFIRFSEEAQEKHEFSKKINDRLVSQIVNGKPYRYNLGQERSVQWVKTIDTFLKKSLNYENKFIQTDEFYRVKYILDSFHNIITNLQIKQPLSNPEEVQLQKCTQSKLSLSLGQIRNIYRQTINLRESKADLSSNSSHNKSAYFIKTKQKQSKKQRQNTLQANVQALQKYYQELISSEQTKVRQTTLNENIVKSLLQKYQEPAAATSYIKNSNEIETTARAQGGLPMIEEKKES